MSLESKISLGKLAASSFVLACVIAGAVWVHGIQSRVDALQAHDAMGLASRSQHLAGAAEAENEPSHNESTQNSSRGLPDRDRITRLERELEDLKVSLDALAALVQSGQVLDTTAAPRPAPPTAAEMTELRARANLRARLSDEVGQSAWGADASTAMEHEIAKQYTNNQFFVDNGGSVEADCRQSVCSVSWSAASDGLSPEEAAELLDRARWELMGLAGAAPDIGAVQFALDPTASPPSITMLMDHEPSGGDDAIPEKVRDYLSGKFEP